MPPSTSCLTFSTGIFEGQRMVLAVGADGVAGVRDLADPFRIGIGLTADDEEGRLDALLGENRQHLVAVFRQRAVIEGQHHLVIGERQRLRILHGADPRMFFWVDHQRA